MSPPTPASPSANDDEHETYPPSEDSDLLVDGARAEIAARDPAVVVEVGTGSGYVLEQLLVRRQQRFYIATEINAAAARTARRRLRLSATYAAERSDKACAAASPSPPAPPVDIVLCNLADALRPRCADLLLFNPPYVPTPDEECERGQRRRDVYASWAGGGRHGRRVIDVFMRRYAQWLRTADAVMLLVSLESNIPDARGDKGDDGGGRVDIVMRRKAGIERLALTRWRADGRARTGA